MKEFWDQRYNTGFYVYGKEPNLYFKSELQKLNPGRILLPGEGEGRNAVYAAINSWKVDAFDQSLSGYNKAIQLSREYQVRFDYQVVDHVNYPLKNNLYDAAGLIFFHLHDEERIEFHSRIIDSLVPGGYIILEAFHTSQSGRDSGGPSSVDYLFSEEKLLADFENLKIVNMDVLSSELNEGTFHNGEARIIRCLAQKL